MKYCPPLVCLPGLFVVLLCGLAGPSLGQTRPVGPLDPKTHRFIYTAVVPVAGASQADLVLRARAWAEQVTPAGHSPVIIPAPDSAGIITTGVCPFAYDQSDLSGKTLLSKLRYTATISVQEGRYRYKVTDFFFLAPGVRQLPPEKIPAETFFNHRFKPNNEDGSRYQETMRTCFPEIAGEVLARLQAAMRQSTSKAGSK